MVKTQKKSIQKKVSNAEKKRGNVKEKFGKLFDIARLDPKQLFLEAQRSTKRYGFIDPSVSNEKTDQDTMDVNGY